jgi:hypothetical protein
MLANRGNVSVYFIRELDSGFVSAILASNIQISLAALLDRQITPAIVKKVAVIEYSPQ